MDEQIIKVLNSIAVSMESLAENMRILEDLVKVQVPEKPEVEPPSPQVTRDRLVEYITTPEAQEACWQWLQSHGAEKIIMLTGEERVAMLSHFGLEASA